MLSHRKPRKCYNTLVVAKDKFLEKVVGVEKKEKKNFISTTEGCNGFDLILWTRVH